MRRLLLHGLMAVLLAVSGMALSACDDAEEVEVEEDEVEVD